MLASWRADAIKRYLVVNSVQIQDTLELDDIDLDNVPHKQRNHGYFTEKVSGQKDSFFYRDFNSIDYRLLYSDALGIDWSDCLYESDIDSKFEKFTN